jgi:hypothetical protein
MRPMPTHEYGGYTIVANALPASENRYYSVFSIHRPTPNTLVIHAPVVYQEGINDGVTCDTAEQAHEDAFGRARMWIDAHPAD